MAEQNRVRSVGIIGAGAAGETSLPIFLRERVDIPPSLVHC